MFSNQNAYASDHVLQIISLSEIATAIYSSEEMVIQAANDVMIKLWGKDRSVIGKSVSEALPELHDQPFLQLYLNVLHTGETYQTANMPTTLVVDGIPQVFYFDFMYKAIKNAKGDIYCVLNTATDVTERYNAELSIRESYAREQALNEELAAANEELEATIEELTCSNEELLQSTEHVIDLNESLSESRDQLNFAIDAGNLGTWDLNPQTMKFTANDRLKEWFGLNAADEMNLELATAAIVNKDRTRVIQAIAEALDYRSGGKYDIQYSVLTSNRTHPKILRTKGKALFNNAKEAYRFSGIVEDITDEYTNSIALAEAQEGFEIALKAAKLGSYELNLKTMEMSSSDQCKVNYGRAITENFSFSDLLETIQPDFRNYVQRQLTDAIENNTVYNAEYPITWTDGSTHWVRSSGKARYNYLGEPVRMNVVSHDITEQKKDEIRKNDFIGMVSHELKTPLTSFKGYIQILQKNTVTKGDDFSINILSKVDRQLDKMSGLVNGFLNLSRLESGKIYLQKEVFNLDQLIAEIIEEQKLLIANHNLILLPCQQVIVDADREKISNVICNLLSNAAKYSPLGSDIEVLCSVEDDKACIQVKDQGEGIPAEDVNRLFERYYRAEHTKHISGFGIGLYLSAEIVERHEGEIGVKSEIGKGSHFWFTLPIHTVIN
jgi:signal transduction histidine kinase